MNTLLRAKQDWGSPHANTQETDGMDTVENRGNDNLQATKSRCWTEERTHLERTTASYAHRATATEICCAESEI